MLQNLPTPERDFELRLRLPRNPNTDISAVLSIPKRSLPLQLSQRLTILDTLIVVKDTEQEDEVVGDEFPVFISAISSLVCMPTTARATHMQVHVILDGTQFREPPEQLKEDARLNCAAIAGFLIARFEVLPDAFAPRA